MNLPRSVLLQSCVCVMCDYVREQTYSSIRHVLNSPDTGMGHVLDSKDFLLHGYVMCVFFV